MAKKQTYTQEEYYANGERWRNSYDLAVKEQSWCFCAGLLLGPVAWAAVAFAFWAIVHLCMFAASV